MRNWKNKISDHISYTEATKSRTAVKYGIDNKPTEKEMENMKAIAEAVFEPLREYFGVPISVTSFYRSKELNSKLGGSSTSQHCKGEAMDLDADVFGMITNRQIFNYIKDNLDFDQLIWEFGDKKDPAWVHVSFKKNGGNRKQILVAYREKSFGRTRTKYKLYDN